MGNLISKVIEHPFKTAFLISTLTTAIAKILQATADFKKVSNSKQFAKFTYCIIEGKYYVRPLFNFCLTLKGKNQLC